MLSEFVLKMGKMKKGEEVLILVVKEDALWEQKQSSNYPSIVYKSKNTNFHGDPKKKNEKFSSFHVFQWPPQERNRTIIVVRFPSYCEYKTYSPKSQRSSLRNGRTSDKKHNNHLINPETTFSPRRQTGPSLLPLPESLDNKTRSHI